METSSIIFTQTEFIGFVLAVALLGGAVHMLVARLARLFRNPFGKDDRGGGHR